MKEPVSREWKAELEFKKKIFIFVGVCGRAHGTVGGGSVQCRCGDEGLSALLLGENKAAGTRGGIADCEFRIVVPGWQLLTAYSATRARIPAEKRKCCPIKVEGADGNTMTSDMLLLFVPKPTTHP